MMKKMTENHKLHIEELTKTGILDLEDLEINHSGHLSVRQKRMLYLYLASWLAIAGLEIIILGVFVYIQVFLQKDFLTGLVGIGFLIIPISSSITHARPFWQDIQDDAPKTSIGELFKRSSTIGGGIILNKWPETVTGFCSIRIDDQVFSVSPYVYNQVIQERHYRVYFVSNSRKLINIEPL
jgi:hypothetical protein